MFREFFRFLQCPDDTKKIDYNVKCISQSIFLYATVIFATMVAAVLILALLKSFFPSLINSKLFTKSELPEWIAIILGPILEECSFRLSLKRKAAYLAICLCTISFLLISSFFYHHIYTLDKLFIRIILALIVGTALFVILRKPMLRCRFSNIFYISASIFAIIHIGNANIWELLPLDYIVIILYVIKQFIMGLLLGYIRMKNGFAVSTVVHILNNAV